MERLSVEEIKHLKQKMQSNMNVYFYDEVMKVFDELISYRDAEEQGLLLRLPFKIGQKVYYIYESCIDKSLMIGSMVYSYSCLDFPREYFATKEEAEQALKQMGE